MGTGHDSSVDKDISSARLFCASGDEVGPDDDDNDNDIKTRPNVLLYAGDGGWNAAGMFWENDLGPQGLTADFAIEAWVKRNYPDSVNNWRTAAADATGYCVTGVDPAADGYPAAGFWFRGANFEAFYSETNAASLVTVTGILPFGWNHVAINFVRGGLFTLYINGISQGTGACGSGAVAFGGGVAGCTGQVAAAAASGKLHPPYRLAAVGFHATTLPTQAEYQTAVDNISLAETAGTTSRLFMGDTKLLVDAPHPASDPANDDEGDWFWEVPDSSVITQLEEYDLEMVNVTETYATSDTDEGGTIYSGAVTFARTGLNMDIWYQRVFSEGSTFRADSIVFGTDPSWPPSSGIGDKGYA